MRAPLTPVKTRICETPSQLARLFDVQAERLKRLHTFGRQLISIFRFTCRARQPFELLEPVVSRNSEMSREVIVTDAPRTQTRRRSGNKLPARLVHQDAQTLEHSGHLWTFETVESVLALRDHFNQSLFFQAIEVRARS
jgi:uncharacterized protein YecE (DUF72 family)